MSTPPSDEPTQPAEPVPPAAEPATPPAPAATPAPAAAPPGYAYATFAPLPRAPRVPWVNPARRGHVVGAAIVGALIALGAGFGIGFAVAGSGDGGHGHMYRNGYYPDMRDHMGVWGPRGDVVIPGQRMYPPGYQTPAPSSSAATS